MYRNELRQLCTILATEWPPLLKIAQNRCGSILGPTESVLGSGGDLAARTPPSGSPTPAPHTAIESKQRLDDLCGAFGGLSESHHRVLGLREFEGLSYIEIAERLGMTRAMVESTLFRARRRLGEEYEDLASGRRCARVQSLIDAGDEHPLTSLGIRERRQLTRHLAHCPPLVARTVRVGEVPGSNPGAPIFILRSGAEPARVVNR